jgi:8-oxo-dGTP diphosphatase
MGRPVRAAGGVVWRPGADGTRDVLLVHRNRHDDWTLPKGKAHEGESDEACGLREVEEETGLRCELGPELASTSYVVDARRPKTVRYWAMRPVAGEAAASNEVDALRWLPLDEARALLTYDRDRAVLDSFAVHGDLRPWLEQLGAGPSGAETFATLAFLAGRLVTLDHDELQAARRRALLVLAAGGDPRRELELDGRAVRGLADDLDTPGGRAQLAAALARARDDAEGLPSVEAALDALLATPDLAWRWFALALLADELTAGGAPSDE